ncbi:hypothetical protein BC831DRAFT_25618 [Entophlyctis helioformis]|nr:hypothetical protein BC831DRAFT_25618 [Entophlyctis helioformis]
MTVSPASAPAPVSVSASASMFMPKPAPVSSSALLAAALASPICASRLVHNGNFAVSLCTTGNGNGNGNGNSSSNTTGNSNHPDLRAPFMAAASPDSSAATAAHLSWVSATTAAASAAMAAARQTGSAPLSVPADIMQPHSHMQAQAQTNARSPYTTFSTTHTTHTAHAQQQYQRSLDDLVAASAAAAAAAAVSPMRPLALSPVALAAATDPFVGLPAPQFSLSVPYDFDDVDEEDPANGGDPNGGDTNNHNDHNDHDDGDGDHDDGVDNGHDGARAAALCTSNAQAHATHGASPAIAIPSGHMEAAAADQPAAGQAPTSTWAST